MRALKTQTGYTIVETLIVLAVTSVMLVATVVLVSGQVQRYRFRDSVLNTQQRVQAALNDVQTGYFSLQNNAVAINAVCTESGSASPGDSKCIYAGKKVTVDTNGLLTATPLWLRDDAVTPIGLATSTVDANQITTSAERSQLPSGVDYTKGATVYVLFTNYPSFDPTAYSGGAQATGTFVSNASSVIATPAANEQQYICMKDGSRKAMLKIGGLDASNTVELSYYPTAVECP